METLHRFSWVGLSFQLQTSPNEGWDELQPCFFVDGNEFFHANLFKHKLTFKYSTATSPLQVSVGLINFRAFPPLVITTVPKSNYMF